MASAFWYLEDGRCFSRRWINMFYLLELINNQIRIIEVLSNLQNIWIILFGMRIKMNIMDMGALFGKALMKV